MRTPAAQTRLAGQEQRAWWHLALGDAQVLPSRLGVRSSVVVRSSDGARGSGVARFNAARAGGQPEQRKCGCPRLHGTTRADGPLRRRGRWDPRPALVDKEASGREGAKGKGKARWRECVCVKCVRRGMLQCAARRKWTRTSSSCSVREDWPAPSTPTVTRVHITQTRGKAERRRRPRRDALVRPLPACAMR